MDGETHSYLSSTENVNDLGYQHLKSLAHEFQMMWTAKDVNGFNSIINVVFFEESKKTLRNKSQAQLILDFRTCLQFFLVIGGTFTSFPSKAPWRVPGFEPFHLKMQKATHWKRRRTHTNTSKRTSDSSVNFEVKQEMVGLPLGGWKILAGFNSFSKVLEF